MEPLNRAELDKLTQYDKAFEKELLATFVTSFETAFTALKQAFEAKDNAQWKEAAHAMKGSGLNVTAEVLAKRCAQAHFAFEAAPTEKIVIIATIEQEYGRVRLWLANN